MSIDRFHNPARNPGESFSDYRIRRTKSLDYARAITHAGLGSPAAQRQRPTTRQALRDSQRSNGKGPKGVFSFGILTAQQRRNRERMQARTPEIYNGLGEATTLVGRRDYPRDEALLLLREGQVCIGFNDTHATFRRPWKPH